MATTNNTKPASDKQIAFIDSLVDDRCNRLLGSIGVPMDRLAVIDAMLAVTMPAPTDMSDASDQINALKGAGMRAYARQHLDWAQPVMVRFAERFGEQGERLPKPATAIDHTHDGKPAGCTTIDGVPACERSARQYIEEVLA